MDLSNIQITKDCIKEISNIGSTTYVNICNGSQNAVPWGTGYWAGALGMTALVIGIGVMFYFMIRDIFYN